MTRRAVFKQADVERAAQVEDLLLANAEDALDSHVARGRLKQLATGQIKTVSGADLDARLAALEAD